MATYTTVALVDSTTRLVKLQCNNKKSIFATLKCRLGKWQLFSFLFIIIEKCLFTFFLMAINTGEK